MIAKLYAMRRVYGKQLAFTYDTNSKSYLWAMVALVQSMIDNEHARIVLQSSYNTSILSQCISCGLAPDYVYKQLEDAEYTYNMEITYQGIRALYNYHQHAIKLI